eukprot:5637029-Ditylum_brightwellii.AAC.1
MTRQLTNQLEGDSSDKQQMAQWQINQGLCDGGEKLMISYQTELKGNLVALYLSYTLLQYLQTYITTQQKLHCNNAVAVSHVNKYMPSGIKSYIAVEFNITREI